VHIQKRQENRDADRRAVEILLVGQSCHSHHFAVGRADQVIGSTGPVLRGVAEKKARKRARIWLQ
jgi:hypothetical protein